MKKINFKKIIVFLFTTAFFFSTAILSMAQGDSDRSGTGRSVIENPLGSLKNIPLLISQLLAYVVKIGGIIAIFAFIYSGYLFVKARGNPKELGVAKETFKGTVIGVSVLLGAQLIASIIIGTIKNLKQ